MKVPNFCIGIDPGANGCICIMPCKIGHKRSPKIMLYEFKKYSLRSLASIFDEYNEDRIDIFIEKSGLHPKNGKMSYYASGRNFGQLEGLLAMYDYTVIGPTKWMNALDCHTQGDKNVTKKLAESIFGKYIKVTHTNADAILIAYYGFSIYDHDPCPRRRK